MKALSARAESSFVDLKILGTYAFFEAHDRAFSSLIGSEKPVSTLLCSIGSN